LESLRRADLHQQAIAFATRAAAHVSLEGGAFLDKLLQALRKAGAGNQAEVLINRLPAEGLFRIFREQDGYQEQYKSGCNPDGDPVDAWGWDDLD
jgi:hypothetical protein